MPNTPISGFTSGAPAQAGDELVIARSGANFKLANSDIKTLIIGAGSVSIASGKTFTSSNTLTLAGTDSTTITFGSASSSFPIVTNPSGAIFQLGAADAAAPVPQTLQVQGVVAGTSNTAGANFTIRGSDSTGNAAGGSIIFQVSPAGSSGTAQNAYSTALTIAGNRSATFTGNVSVSGANSSISFPDSGTTSTGSGPNIANYFDTIGFFAGSTLGGRFQNTLGWILASGNAYTINADVCLYRDAANIFAIRGGGGSGTLRVYNSGDTTNFQRLVLSCGVTSNMAVVAANNGGTGLACGLQFGAALTTGGGTTNIFNINTSGHTVWNTDNTYDIGSSANRPKTGYFGTSVVVGTPSAFALAQSYGLYNSASTASRAIISESTAADSSTSGGLVIVSQNAGSAVTSGARLGAFFFSGNTGATLNASAFIGGFATENWTASPGAQGSRFEFATTANGGTSRTTKLIIGNSGVITFGATEASTVPALKPSSTTLQVRLGDDSANAALTCGTTTAAGTALNVTGTGDASIMSVTNTSTGTLLSVVNSSSSTIFSVADTPAITLIDAMTIAVGTGTGTKIGTATNQKIGFFNATPVIQQTVTTDLLDSLQALGLIASGAGNTPLNLTDGAFECGTITSGTHTLDDAANIVVGTTTGTKIGTATSQKIGFWDKAPIAQPTTGIAEATFVENSGGTAVNVDSTFGGYTLQQVVQALQNVGLLA